MDTDFPVKYTDIRDDSTFDDDGKVYRFRRYTFRLGKFGPFTERVALENLDPQEIERRIMALRGQLQSHHRL
jgi:hypothetical protein